MIRVARADPRDPGPRALLEASHALMRELFEPEENHFLSVDELAAKDIRFFAATEDGEVLGTGALAVREGYGEVKAMFTAEAARGRGIGALILVKLEEEARALGLPLMRLETGDKLEAARRLYGRAGFVVRGPFADYVDHDSSIFMEKVL
ncbi:putative acetyltransferase protein [Oceanicola granulosus HTCC2516]|uniref:Putative acetyltransferase protein n=1 Tax=Oceanicola granulosus (strain ATCC BAA-861 / DSM 15982 / KCTC 12143 / HTCC2516) TaxID=314256 RepID=Q2CK36_OCEGH|nr:GNAT family N-acetyltransferase [Oceanicola granulosus]EAR52953.1 putative acetyltransferase protein [Oceanicola granulosus HTCC2516]